VSGSLKQFMLRQVLQVLPGQPIVQSMAHPLYITTASGLYKYPGKYKNMLLLSTRGYWWLKAMSSHWPPMRAFISPRSHRSDGQDFWLILWRSISERNAFFDKCEKKLRLSSCIKIYRYDYQQQTFSLTVKHPREPQLRLEHIRP